MAWVRFITPVIKAEEIKFRKLLERFDGLSELEPKEAFNLWQSQGLPIELAEELVTDLDAFRVLVAGHKAKSGNKFTSVYG
jgi:alanyl-tRNA synthetase